ncbi:MAG: AMP-binding protein, partial [archaeon]|nr:AMP-binding protein [archaeon]
MKADNLNEVLAQIRANAETRPDFPAIVGNNGKDVYTYKELMQLVDDIAYKLKSLGVGPGVIVPIRSGRVVEHYAARLASILVGCITLSLDLIIPEERAQGIIKTIGCKTVIDDSFFPVEHAPVKMEYPALPENIPGFIIFTSGSTGTPKGVLHPRA